ncbi:MAG: T9SS type A sorting domain-containing protein, partial [Ignavibacteriae bacterium]|nr:T9SS C-terminal target domain-containing protein [Ignavibacteriota bacterium]NOH00332.1 T9SS type A sorting domain-containing protein [Ignavibacteriota bacterium]
AQYSFSPDLISPILHSVEVLDNTSLRIKFSEPINKTSAEEIQNYNIDNDVEVLTAVLSSTDEVSLTTSEHNPGNYTIIVSNIEDLAGNIIDLNFNRLNYTIIEYADLLLLSTYDFFKGEDPTIVYDRSSNGEPLNLAIEDITCVQWLKPNGLAVISPTKIISQDLPTKIVDACVLSGEISIEVWLKPIKLKQSGPARIVSLSANSFGRNFTLGQSTTDGLYDIYDVRLRTTESNSNGIPSVSTEPGSVTKSLTHLVYTRNSEGFTKIYLNSNEIISDSLGGDFSNWDDSFPLILANEATNDRPWLGEFYRLSIYNTMLSQQKVDSLFNYSNITDVKNEKSNTPSDYRLDQNYPNPFNPNTKIRFSIPRRGNVNLKVFNILGEEIVDLVNSELKSGAYSVDFNAEDLPSGIYFYQLITENFSDVKKMILLK